MIENNILKSNFLGRDGFRWWVGQVAPEEAQGKQINGAGWGNRLKVRILGYHPDDDIELTNEQLPYAHVLLSPESGSGRGNKGKSIKIMPGDNVFGFFLDGDDAQQPIIMGVFANTRQASTIMADKYEQPFVPFSGYTSKIKSSDFMIKNEISDQSGQYSQKSVRHISPKQAKQLQDKTKEIERSASASLGQVVNFAGNNQNTPVNKIKSELQNAVSNFDVASAKEKSGILDNVARKISGISNGISGSIINKTYAELAPKLNTGLHDLYKKTYALILAATQNPAIAKKAGTAAQTAMVGPVRSIQNFLPCAAKNISENLFGSIRNILGSFLNNVKNFTDCIGDQFVGAIFNDVINKINGQLGGLMKGVSKIFNGNLIGMLRSTAEGILGMANAFDCDLPVADLASKTNQWTIGKGPKDNNMFNLDKVAGGILATANAAQSLQEAAASPGGILGNLGIFDFMRPDVSTPGFGSQLSDCYTGPPLNCSGIQVNIFGGGGEGATGKAILGAIVGDTFAEQTGSLLGIKMTDGGSGYTTPPFVEIVDNCDQGFGAVARAVVDYDPQSPTYQQVVDVYVVSPGENYPVIETDDEGVYTVDHVTVVNSGQDYTSEDTITDDKGNNYTFFLDDSGGILNVIPPDPERVDVEPVTEQPELTITSSTGFGAVISAQILPRPEFQGEIKQVIDCITPRDGIVGFVNGEAYYGPFHVMPNGIKMTGAKHSDSDFIIYDTPQASRVSTARSLSSTSQTTPIVTSSPISYTSPTQTNVSNTTTPSQTTTSATTQTGTTDTSSQQTSGQSDTSSNNNNTNNSGSSGSGGSYSGY